LSKKWKGVISLFIIFNCLASVIAPVKPRSEQNAIQRFFYDYALWTRLLQEWSLFTPNPRKFIVYYRFQIEMQNGQKIDWVRPYPENWDFFQRHLAYNWQKFDLAGHNLDRPDLYPDVADYMSRKFANDSNPPHTIKLFREEASIPPPKPTGDAWPTKDELHFMDVPLFTYVVADKKFL
jgi:hypothetical protein